ncbi:TraB domain-containing protein [Linum grandiflorum]
MDPALPESTEAPPREGEDFIHVDNPDPMSDSIVNVADELRNDDDGHVEAGGEVEEAATTETAERSAEPPEELSKTVVLNCQSTAESGSCDVYLVGTAHVSEESCREVEAIIRYLKPEVVFLELCASRVTVLTPQTIKVPTTGEMVEMWKKKHNLFGILYSWFLAKVASKLKVFPGAEFRVAYEEANKYGGKVVLGDRPVQVTLRRTWFKMPIWHKTKLVYSLLFQAVFLSSPEELKKMLKEMDDADMVTLVIQEMSKTYPTLMETLVHERDQYMSSMLHRYASEHSSVVAVVGRGHLRGIQKHWEQPVSMDDLMEVPKPKAAVSVLKIITSLGVAAAGVAIVSGIYLSRKK